MEDVYDHSTLADRFDSDDEGIAKPKKHSIAPNINPLTAMRKVNMKRLFIDSRDRNRVHYTNASDFRMSMTVPIKGVRSVTLTNAKIPLVGGCDYVAIVLTNLRDRTLYLPKESPGLPAGVLAIVPLIPYSPIHNFAIFQSDTNQKSGGSQGGWRVAFPQGMPMLNELHFQLYTWSWDAVNHVSETIFLPLTSEPVIAVEPSTDNNITLQLEIEHELQ